MPDYGNNITLKRLWGGRKLFSDHPGKLLLYPAIKKCAPYSMLNYASFCQVHDALATLKRENIEGSVVETGCWKGGCGAFMALSGRKTFLLDSFEGLPANKGRMGQIALLRLDGDTYQSTKDSLG